MQKSSLKLYFATFVFTLALATFTFAGEGHCPDAPPPAPGDDGRLSVQVVEVKSAPADSQILKNIWDLIAHSIRLF
jgi:hypothetical protein